MMPVGGGPQWPLLPQTFGSWDETAWLVHRSALHFTSERTFLKCMSFPPALAASAAAQPAASAAALILGSSFMWWQSSIWCDRTRLFNWKCCLLLHVTFMWSSKSNIGPSVWVCERVCVCVCYMACTEEQVTIFTCKRRTFLWTSQLVHKFGLSWGLR